MKRAVFVGDFHVGSTVALCPAKFPIEDGGTYKPNKFQKWLLNCWQAAKEEIIALHPDVLVFTGDEIDGINRKNSQLWTNRVSYQVGALLELTGDLCDAVEHKYVVKGTPWHVGGAADHVEGFAKQIGATPGPSTGEYTWYNLKLSLGGPVIDVTHHIGTSRVPLYEATAPLRDLLILITELVRVHGTDMNVKAIVRGHRHRMLALSIPPGLWAVTNGCWQLKTEFIHKVSQSTLPHIGYSVIENDEGQLKAWNRAFGNPKPHIEVI